MNSAARLGRHLRCSRLVSCSAAVARRFLVVLLLGPAFPSLSQPLRDPGDERPEDENVIAEDLRPLMFRDNAPGEQSRLTVEQAIARLRAEMREIAEADIADAERKKKLDELHRRNALIFRVNSAGQASTEPRTVEEAVQKLERLIYEAALEAAPDEASRESLSAGPLEQSEPQTRQPVLIAPRSTREKITLTPHAEQSPTRAHIDDKSPDNAAQPKNPTAPADDAEKAVQVAVLADEKTTLEMHDDVSILRDVESESGELVLFDALHVWAGGAVQLDAYGYDDLFNAKQGGDSSDGTATRRGEVIVRSTLYHLGEFKLQYDVEGEFWRDLYFRVIDEERNMTVTVGNQKEPFSQENLLGNKSTAAMEESAPTSIFAPARGLGVRVNKWFDRSPDNQVFQFDNQSTSYITTSFGIFGEDFENTSDTDLAMTGRLTVGRGELGKNGIHFGVSASYRDGDFSSINPRPELNQADRINLASFDADRTALLGLEALYTHGSLHASSELYLADFHGGDVDANGYGGFIEVGYYLTGQVRDYRPQWGLWAPLNVGAHSVFELTGRISYTYGDSNDEASNDLRMITLGANWYYRNIRASLSLFYSETDRDINGENSGTGAAARLQFLF